MTTLLTAAQTALLQAIHTAGTVQLSKGIAWAGTKHAGTATDLAVLRAAGLVRRETGLNTAFPLFELTPKGQTAAAERAT